MLKSVVYRVLMVFLVGGLWATWGHAQDYSNVPVKGHVTMIDLGRKSASPVR